MPNGIMIAYILIIFVGIGIWFWLYQKLTRHLKTYHLQVYQSLGNPNLVTNNIPNNNVSLLKFISNRQHKTMNDSKLSKLSDFMLVYFVAFLVIWVGGFTMVVQSQYG